MLSKKVEEILNSQVEKESFSSHLYLYMATWAETNGLEGVSKWLYVQSNEERMHMLKFIGYINERGGVAKIGAIKNPASKFKNVKDLFTAVLNHERFISKSINEIVGVCVAERDFTTQNWVQWFVNEQIEEEKNVRIILDKLSLLGDSNMYLFDRDIMSLRVNKPANTGIIE
jgi:ferritin